MVEYWAPPPLLRLLRHHYSTEYYTKGYSRTLSPLSIISSFQHGFVFRLPWPDVPAMVVNAALSSQDT